MSAMDLTLTLYKCKIQSVQHLLAHIDVTTNPGVTIDYGAHENLLSDQRAAERLAFVKCLTWYLEGVGHPREFLDRELVTQEEFDKEETNTLFRANTFLKSITDSDSLPFDQEKAIEVCKLNPSIEQNDELQLQIKLDYIIFSNNEPEGLTAGKIATCFSSLTIPMSGEVSAVLIDRLHARELEDRGAGREETHAFDLWIHGQTARTDYSIG